jgi:hypothetical protein
MPRAKTFGPWLTEAFDLAGTQVQVKFRVEAPPTEAKARRARRLRLWVSLTHDPLRPRTRRA